MSFLTRFTKLMKSEPTENKQKQHYAWVIDESKCLSIDEVKRLRGVCNKAKMKGLQNNRFASVRNWFMVELGLETGLRVEEMASLKLSNLLLDGARSSIVLVGKGGKKRAVWISSEFKRTCQTYLNYKKRFGYFIDDESYLLNNLKGGKITKRALQKFFKIILKKAQLPSHYYIHCLRHTYTTFLLKASKYNYRFAQQQLGHSSIRTTQVYAGVIESEGKKALENLYR
jgi:site-specific recombinase XerD